MKFRLFIFDLDGTLYDLDDVVLLNYNMQVDFLRNEMGQTEDEVVEFLSRNHIFPYVCIESKSATELFAAIGLSKEAWKLYREKHFKVSNISKEKAATKEVMGEFASIGKLVLLSSNSYKNISDILNYLSIPQELFDKIVCSDNFNSQKFNKYDAMKLIMQEDEVASEEVLSIGDRYETDIVPMIKLGGKGVIVSSPQNLKAIFNDIRSNNLKSSVFYTLYP